MKRIINRKVYNTETAIKIYSWDNGLNDSDFRIVDEVLYKTKNGRYFICGCGGALTKYAQSCGNNSMSGACQLWVVDKEEAMDWLEVHDGEEALLKYFKGEIEEA